MNRQLECAKSIRRLPPAVRKVGSREGGLWGFAVTVTLVLTFAILSLTFPSFYLYTDKVYLLNLREWVRGLTAVVLLFVVYTIYQHAQLEHERRELAACDG